MKLFTNLPGNLRALFGFLRILTLLTAFSWLGGAIFFSPLLGRWLPERNFHITMGDVALKAAPDSIRLKEDTGKADSLRLRNLRGSLRANFSTRSEPLQARLAMSIIPAALVVFITSYLLFTALRNLCAQLEAGQVFTEQNLLLVRRIGLVLVVSSVANAILSVWAAFIMSTYLNAHAVLGNGLEFAGQVAFELPTGPLSIPAGLIIGSLVLMVTEAFRQGMKLKAENDLTV